MTGNEIVLSLACALAEERARHEQTRASLTVEIKSLRAALDAVEVEKLQAAVDRQCAPITAPATYDAGWHRDDDDDGPVFQGPSNMTVETYRRKMVVTGAPEYIPREIVAAWLAATE